MIFSIILEAGLRVGEIGEDKRTCVPPLKIRNIEDILLGRSYLINLDRAKYHPDGRSALLINDMIIEELRRFISLDTGSGTGIMKGEEFIEYIKGIRDEPVFLSQKGNAISVRQIQTIFNGLCKKAGISPDKSHTHVLRHTHAVICVKNKLSIESLRKNLGHKSIKTTGIYFEMVMDDAQDDYSEMYDRMYGDSNV